MTHVRCCRGHARKVAAALLNVQVAAGDGCCKRMRAHLGRLPVASTLRAHTSGAIRCSPRPCQAIPVHIQLPLQQASTARLQGMQQSRGHARRGMRGE